jgi:hypothetical protein
MPEPDPYRPLIGMTGMTSPEIQQLGVNLPHSAL